MTDKLPEWVQASEEDFAALEPTDDPRISDDDREAGLVLRGPFAIESKTPNAPPTVLALNLGFRDSADDDRKVLDFSDGDRVHHQAVTGRVRIDGDTVLVATADWGRLRIRPLALSDAKNPAANLPSGIRPKNVAELAEYLLGRKAQG